MGNMDKRIIGVCLARVHGEFCRNFLSTLKDVADKNHYQLCVFHSIYDFLKENDGEGAAQVVSMIPYEELCGMVVLHDSIYDKGILNEIIDRSQQADIPVIMAKGYEEGCFGIKGESEKNFEDFVEKIVTHNQVKSSFFLAGRDRAGSDSNIRLKVWKKVMERHSLPSDESCVGYGEYNELLTNQIIDGMTADKKPLPELIVCANDTMAIAAINRLNSHGIRVPEDVLVTGFDGLESADFCTPSLATCKEDVGDLASRIMSILDGYQEGQKEPENFVYYSEPIYAKSAGFDNELTPSISGAELFSRARLDESDEDICNSWLDLVIERPFMQGLVDNLPKWKLPRRTLLIRTDDFIESTSRNVLGVMPERALRIVGSEEDNIEPEECDVKESIKEIVRDIPEGFIRFFSMISYGELVYGVTSELVRRPKSRSGHINRQNWTLNRGLMIALNGERQLRLSQKVSNAKYTDPLTGRLNLHGASLWFYSFANDSTVHENRVTIGLYRLINSDWLIEQNGTEFIEEAMLFISNSLYLSNPDVLEIIRTDMTSMAVICMYDPDNQTGFEVDEVVAFFYNVLQSKKDGSKEWEHVEVSCGYHIAEPGWNGKLDDMLADAQSELYLNRMHFDQMNTLQQEEKNDSAKMLEFQMKFMALLKGNFFHFHFQPIVDARTGEIVAYEGLMRTDAKIGMNPLEVLDAAKIYNKLFDVELACFDGILKRMKAEKGLGDRKVYINTIPGHFLREKDQARIREEYQEELSNVLIEITESMTSEHEEVDAIRNLQGGRQTIPIAVDDYGTGHSNIVNLLEYKPQVVKIDRYLVHEIQIDRNKQMFVKNLLEMAKENHMKVLAEGVETAEELKAVIRYGVDLIQGYYTARPASEFLLQLPENLKEEILEANKYRGQG